MEVIISVLLVNPAAGDRVLFPQPVARTVKSVLEPVHIHSRAVHPPHIRQPVKPIQSDILIASVSASLAHNFSIFVIFTHFYGFKVG
jgi:hypothetical protein